MQASLFDAGDLAFDPHLRGLRRLPLGRDAWVDYLPNWVQGHQWLYAELARTADWQHARRLMYERVVEVPRLTAPAPCQGPAKRVLSELSRVLSLRYWMALQDISLAWYRDGKDSVAPHGDKSGRHVNHTIVAIVSVGAPRRFLLRPLPTVDGETKAFSLGWGDLLVMGGSCQRHWQHAIPKSSHADPRISIMFRPNETSDDKHLSNPISFLRSNEALPARSSGDQETRGAVRRHIAERKQV